MDLYLYISLKVFKKPFSERIKGKKIPNYIFQNFTFYIKKNIIKLSFYLIFLTISIKYLLYQVLLFLKI